MVKNTIKPYRSSFSIKATCQENQEWNVLCIRSMMSFMSHSKLFKFITLRKLIKPPQNFVHAFFSVNITKVCHKNRGEALASGSL